MEDARTSRNNCSPGSRTKIRSAFIGLYTRVDVNKTGETTRGGAGQFRSGAAWSGVARHADTSTAYLSDRVVRHKSRDN